MTHSGYRLPLFLILVLVLAICATVPVMGQNTPPVCDIDCNPPTPPNPTPPPPPPPQSGIPYDRAQPSNQTGMGTLFSATVTTGGAATVQGSSSYTYSVPMFAKPGRAGTNLNLALYYNSHIWVPDAVGGMMMGFDRNTPGPGFQLNYGFVEWNPTPNGPPGILTTPDGAKHTLALDISNMVPNAPPPNNTIYRCANNICLYNTDDSSYTNVSRPLGTIDNLPCLGPNNCPAKDITVTYKNGTQAIYQSFAVVTNDLYDEFVMRPYKITDSNGNITNITYLNSSDLNISTITDPMGRTLNFFYTFAQVQASPGQAPQNVPLLTCVTDGASCSAAGARTYTFTWDQSHAINFNFSLPGQVLIGGFLSGVNSGFTVPVLTKVCRPDLTCVQFNYGDWGIVNDIQELGTSGATRYELSYDFPTSSAGQLKQNPTYATQTEIVNGKTNLWGYSAALDANGLITSSAITDPTGVTTTTYYSRNGDWQDGLPTQIATTKLQIDPCNFTPCQGLLTRNLAWASDLAMAQSGITNGGYNTGRNPRVAGITTILDDGSQSKVTLQYDNSAVPVAAGAPSVFTGSGSVIDRVETDLGATAPGPVLRETVTAYTSLGNHILGLPTDVKVKDGNGKVVSHTIMAYDTGSGVQGVSPLPTTGHDNVGYSATSTAPRGNLTSTTVYADPVGNTGGITSTFTYDMLGNRIGAVSGCCTQTTWNYSSNTQYAYPDSMVTGPAGNQLTTSYTYDVSNGLLASQTDPNGQITSFKYDLSGRLASRKTPDGVTITTNYDGSSANPSVSSASSANQIINAHTVDFQGHPVSDQVFQGTSLSSATLVSTTAYVTDSRGRPTQVSNPYGPNDAPLYTVYSYDSLGRVLTMTPPALVAGIAQKPYTTSFTGASTLVTDPALHQVRTRKDALGRIVQVDQPGQSGGVYATGSATITGSDQSVASSSSSNGATAGTASIVINPTGTPCSSTITDRCSTQITQQASSARVIVTVGGTSDGTITTSNQLCTGGPPSTKPLVCRTVTSNVADTGNLQFSVNVGGTVISSSAVPYNGGSTSAGLAGALVNAFPPNALVSVGYTAGSTSFALQTVATGAATNNTLLSTALQSTGCQAPTGDTTTVSCTQGWSISPAQHFTGGADQVTATNYDTGTVTVAFTTGAGVTYSEHVPYGQNDNGVTLATALSNQFNSDPNVNSVVVASHTGNTFTLTTFATGAGTNYAITAAAGTNSQFFAGGSASFMPSAPATFSPGQNGTLWDSGTIKATLTGFGGTVATKTINYGQGSSPQSIAVSLAGAFHGDLSSPVDATVAAGTSTITFTAKIIGSDPNSYSVSIVDNSSQAASFPSPSFPTVSAQLAGGLNTTSSFDPSVVLTTTYTYDPLGNVLQSNAGQQTRTFVYDGLGRMTSAATPETAGQPVKYTYTDFGAIATKTDVRVLPGTSTPITTTYSYDPLNRTKTVTYNDSLTPNVTYTYNPPMSSNNTGGRLASVSSSVETKAYQYDVMGRILQCLETIGANSYTVKYGYTSDGVISSITYPSSHVVNYSYDSLDRLNAVSWGTTQNILSINSADYNAAGQALVTSYGNGTTGHFGYNQQQQISGIQYSAAAPATPLLSLSYSYGDAAANGQILGITDNVVPERSTSYKYNVLGQLQTAQTVDLSKPNTWKLAYSYDRFGNRLTQTPEGGAGAMPSSVLVVDPATNRIQGAGVLYDAGNMVSDAVNNYGFDAKNRLTSTSPRGLGGAPSNFSYGPDSALVNRNGTYFIYAGGQVIAEYAGGTAAASPSMEYVNLGGNQLATITGATVTFVYADHLSNRVTADLSGKSISTYGHFPSGETFYQTGPASDFDFTSYRRDTNSGLDYADARFYSSRVGRFVSADPLLGDNRYAYAYGDPVNNVDPSGLLSFCVGNACGPGCDLFCIDPGGIFGGGDTACALCGETLGLPPGMKIEPQTLGGLLQDALGLSGFCNPLSPISDGCGLTGFASTGQGSSSAHGPCDTWWGPQLPGTDNYCRPTTDPCYGQGAACTVGHDGGAYCPEYPWPCDIKVKMKYVGSDDYTGETPFTPGWGQILTCVFGGDPEIFQGQDAQHAPENDKEGVLVNGGKYQPGTGTGRGVNMTYRGTVGKANNPAPGRSVGNGVALVGNASNCLAAH